MEKVYMVIDDTGKTFLINGNLSIYRTEQKAKENCGYCEQIISGYIIY